MKKYVYLYLTAFTVSLTGLLSGFDTGVISGAMLYINRTFDINDHTLGLIVSSISLGAIIGSFINGYLVDKAGRKNVLILTAVVFTLGSILSGLAQNPLMLIAARLICGIGVGAASFCGPMYLSEITTKEKRGQIVSFYQLFLTFGILFSYLLNFACSDLKYNWRIMLGFGGVLGIFLLIGLIFQKDTPRFLVLKNKTQDAKNLIKKFNPEADADFAIKEIKETIHGTNKIKFEKYFVYPFIIGTGLMAVQVGTGINSIIYYAPVIFSDMGFKSDNSVLLITIFIGLINFLMTFVALKFSDKIGRKPLLYLGLSGMSISLIILALAFQFDHSVLKYLAIGACMTYIVSFSMSLGPVGLLIISEVFPLKIRGLGMSCAIITNFTVNFFVTRFFPVLLNKIGGFYTFLLFFMFCLISFVFVYFIVPETKNRSLEEIEKSFKLKA